MKEIRVRRLPFVTIFKMAYVASITSALLAVCLVGVIRLFVTFPEPTSTSLLLWFIYLIIGPFFSALGIAVTGWAGVACLAKVGWIEFRIEVLSNERPNQPPEPTAPSGPGSP